MNVLFVDTAGWIAAADRSDTLNQPVMRARDKWLKENGVLATTDYVIDETLTLLRMRLGIEPAETWWAQIEGSRRISIEYASIPRLEKARSLFFRYRDQDYSLTDCLSFTVMRELRIRHALTLDNHFRTMGFMVLP